MKRYRQNKNSLTRLPGAQPLPPQISGRAGRARWIARGMAFCYALNKRQLEREGFTIDDEDGPTQRTTPGPISQV